VGEERLYMYNKPRTSVHKACTDLHHPYGPLTPSLLPEKAAINIACKIMQIYFWLLLVTAKNFKGDSFLTL